MDFNKFLEALGGKRKFIFLSQEVSHKYGDETIKILFDKYNKHITLKIPFQGNLTASAVKDNSSDDVALESNSEHITSLPEIRRILKELFKKHLISLEIRKPYIRLRIDVRDIIKKGNHDVVRKICDLAFKLRETISSYGDALPETYSKKGYYLIYAIPIVAMITEIFLGFYLCYLARNDFSTMTSPLLATIYAFPVVILYVFWAIKFLKRQGLSHIYTAHVITIGAIWLLASIPFITAVNGYFDRSKEQEYDFGIAAKYIRASGGRPTYHITLDNDKNKTCDYYPILCAISKNSISIRKDEYDKVIPRKNRVKIYLKDGRLGLKWYTRYMIY